MAREDKFLVIEYDPYGFVYSIEQEDGNFFGLTVFETLDRIVIPYPLGFKLMIQDRNKTHFNLANVTNIQLSSPMATLRMDWEALTEPFREQLAKILDVSRLKVRLSFDSGVHFVEGEFKTVIKNNNLTGYNDQHMQKVEIDFLTQFNRNLIPRMFGEHIPVVNGLTNQSDEFLTNESGEILTINVV